MALAALDHHSGNVGYLFRQKLGRPFSPPDGGGYCMVVEATFRIKRKIKHRLRPLDSHLWGVHRFRQHTGMGDTENQAVDLYLDSKN